MSMTCKAFLEPGLDSVWYSIDSFEAIVSPFTKSVWRKEEFKNPWPGGPPSILLHLEGPLEAPDVERFTKYYAPRIRKILFNAYCGMTMMSLETCEALNLATNRQPGSLSPFLQQFSWHNFHEIEEIYGERFMLGIAPYVALFTGETTRSVSYNSWTRLPLEAGSIQSISGNVPRLRKLILQTNDFNLVHGILTSSPWNYLEELVVTSLSKDDIPCVGSLPQLSNLHVIRLADLDAPGYGHRTDGAFSTLRELVVCATELHNITSFLKYVDPRNTIHTLACESWYVSPTSESQDLVDTIHTRFNPLTLTHLQVIDGEWGDEDQEYMMSSDVMVEEKQDMEFVEETDISCLFAFPNLKLLTFSVKGRPRITPQGVTKITETWPHLQSLDLCGTHPYGSSQTPYIDHNHLSKILYGCPLLQHLGMPFDATRISESERLPHGPFPKLLNLRICGSPIRSHSRVTAFIQQNIPELKKLDVQYSWKYMECLNQTRWDAVAKALGMEQSWSSLGWGPDPFSTPSSSLPSSHSTSWTRTSQLLRFSIDTKPSAEHSRIPAAEGRAKVPPSSEHAKLLAKVFLSVEDNTVESRVQIELSPDLSERPFVVVLLLFKLEIRDQRFFLCVVTDSAQSRVTYRESPVWCFVDSLSPDLSTISFPRTMLPCSSTIAPPKNLDGPSTSLVLTEDSTVSNQVECATLQLRWPIGSTSSRTRRKEWLSSFLDVQSTSSSSTILSTDSWWARKSLDLVDSGVGCVNVSDGTGQGLACKAPISRSAVNSSYNESLTSSEHSLVAHELLPRFISRSGDRVDDSSSPEQPNVWG